MRGPTERAAFVWGSAARREVLSELADDPRSRQTVVETADASESAVYDAINRLERRDYVFERDDGRWAVTGTGQLFTDLLRHVETVESVVETAPDYWAAHDLSVLPESPRRELHSLRGCEPIRSPEADPFRAARYVQNAIRRAQDAAIVAPMYDDRFAEALVESEDDSPRLLVTRELVEETDDATATRHDVDDVRIRICDAAYAMAVTETGVYLSLPRLDGSYDPRTQLVAETTAAVEWGRSMFDQLWAAATPLSEVAIA
ncbi:helix-turn-helix transcriptional regulator [Haloarchaeobius sp. TZWWS8]|uniref:helix-turn-helix transcriptional regulator n=1 Tax=Haloarchaeobius sp. TZWWS8 TaxID=3446121 RepID=UPI003EB6A4DA